jgi:signal transduction histidine kinase
MMPTVFAMAACMLLALPATALEPGVIELHDGTTRIELLPFALTAFEDAAGDAPQRLGYRPDPTRFTAAESRRLWGSIDAKVVWLCFTLRNAASARSWLLETGPVGVEDVSVYFVDPDGSVENRTVYSNMRSNEGRHYLSEYTFRLTMGSGQAKTVYMRFASEGLLRVRANLWDSFAYLKANEFDLGFTGFLLGALLAVFIYTFLVAVSLREGANGFYLTYLFGLLFMIAMLNGAGGIVTRFGYAWVARRAMSFSWTLMTFGMALFARSFLSLKSRSPFFSTLLLVVACLGPPYLVGLAVLNLRMAMSMGNYLDMLSRLAVLAAAVYAVRGGGRRERYFLGSIVFATVGFALSRLGFLGFLMPEFEKIWGKGEVVGSLAQVLILSYGISDAINAMRREKEKDQRSSIELLERANKVKEEFLIGTSLEFRSPLFGIVGLIDAMDDLTVKYAQRAEVALGDEATAVFASEEHRLSALVKAEALRLLGSVANIATYVRLRNDDLALVTEKVSLREIVDGAEGSAWHIASGKDVTVEKAVDEAEIRTDGRVLEQIVYNLLADAFKRSPSGIVRVEGGMRGGRVALAVVDSAPSLDEDVLSRFHTKGSPSGPEAVGPGLELLVARLLAERLGGSLGYSWSNGHGRFYLDLPREGSWRQAGRADERVGLSSILGWMASRSVRPVQADLSETSPGKHSRGLILAYDEDPVFLEALKRYLEGRGYAVAPTLSADKAVELASERRFDLVLLDASGQGRAGLAACARIRAVRSMEELPVVVMTDRESAEAVEAAFRAGASDYLPKLSPNELLFSRVDTHVSLRRSVEEALETRRRVAELEKLKTLGILAAGVAHEVNTPNNAVIRNLPVISEVWRELSPILRRLMEESEGFSVRGWTGEELMRELPELLADTYNAGLQIKKIVEDLKDYARDFSLSPPEPVDISAVAAYAARLLQPLVGRSTHRFVLDNPPGLPNVNVNFQKLTQVAVNVLENALQSLAGPDSSVTLRTRFDSGRGCVILECEDEGKGIHPSHVDKLFVPFFTTKLAEGGTGLGLSVALGIVRDAGGEIELDSVQGRGTMVRVVLPAILDAERGSDE